MSATPGKSRRKHFSEEARRDRVESIRQRSGMRLPSLNTSAIDSRSVSGNIENFIGTVPIPLGLAGPLLMNFKGSAEKIYAPVATTEGALISSMTRGALAVSLSGGVTTRVLSERMIRAPQFEFESIDGAIEFCEWLQSKVENLKTLVKDKSAYSKLIEIQTKVMGRTVHAKFVFTTGDAAGQNMSTFCTSYLCNWLLGQWSSETRPLCLDYIIEGNLSSDKKVSALSMMDGRGRTVMAEAVLTEAVLKRVMKLSVDEIINRFQRSKSARVFTGMVGYNINVANVVAGIFLATGQDVACVHESSLGELHMEKKNGDLYVSMYMPALVVGTVGGGTQLPSFRDNLDMLGCSTVGGANRLAEIIAGFALALDLSTLAAIGAGHFVSAHEKHAREYIAPYMKPSDINKEFFQKSLVDEKISKIEKIIAENKQGLLTDMAQQVSKKYSGMLAYEIESEDANRKQIKQKAFLKVKPKDREVVLGAARILEISNPGLAKTLMESLDFLPFKNSHTREIELLAMNLKSIRQISPQYLGSFVDHEKEAYILIQELFAANDIVSEVEDLSLWTPERKADALSAILQTHRQFLNNEVGLKALENTLLNPFQLKDLEKELSLWESLYCISYSRLQKDYPALSNFYENALDNYAQVITELGELPQTLIHYDFNPRNIAFKAGSKPMIFDWEFAAKGPAQRDLVEFIVFSARPEFVLKEFAFTSEQYFTQLHGHDQDASLWNKGMKLALQEMILRRLPFYFILAEFVRCSYLDRVLENLNALAASLEEK